MGRGYLSLENRAKIVASTTQGGFYDYPI